MFITKHGIFYEGQLLYRYLYNNGNLYFHDEVILQKFIIHKRNNSLKLYCRIYEKDRNTKTRNTYTINCEQLGEMYKLTNF